MSVDTENEATRAPTKVEHLKEISDGLGGFLLDELADLGLRRGGAESAAGHWRPRS